MSVLLIHAASLLRHATRPTVRVHPCDLLCPLHPPHVPRLAPCPQDACVGQPKGRRPSGPPITVTDTPWRDHSFWVLGATWWVLWTCRVTSRTHKDARATACLACRCRPPNTEPPSASCKAPSHRSLSLDKRRGPTGGLYNSGYCGASCGQDDGECLCRHGRQRRSLLSSPQQGTAVSPGYSLPCHRSPQEAGRSKFSTTVATTVAEWRRRGDLHGATCAAVFWSFDHRT